MANDEGSERADKIAGRREERKTRRSRGRGRESQADNTDETSEMSETSNASGSTDTTSQSAGNTDETEKTGETDNTDDAPVREQTHVAMYLPQDLADDLDLRFDELNLEYRKAHDEKMTKNGEFYPALARAAINDTTLRDELDLEEKDE